MFVVRYIKTREAFIQFFRGTEVCRGTDGVTVTADETFTDENATFETDAVAEGDRVYLSGLGEFVVDSVTSETELEFTEPVPSDAADVHWRICRGGVAYEDVHQAYFESGQSVYEVWYDTDIFVN